MSRVAEKLPENSFAGDEYTMPEDKKPDLHIVRDNTLEVQPQLIHPVSEDTVLFTEDDVQAGKKKIEINRENQEVRDIKDLKAKLGINDKTQKKDVVGLTGSKEEQVTLEKMRESMLPHFTVDQVLQAAQKGSLSYEIMPKNIADEDVVKKAWQEAEKRMMEEDKNTSKWGAFKRIIGITGKSRMEKMYDELTDFMKSMSISTGHIEATQDAIASSQQRAEEHGSASTNYYERKEK